MSDLASYCEGVDVSGVSPESLSNAELACAITQSMSSAVAEVATGVDVFFLLVMVRTNKIIDYKANNKQCRDH